MKTTLESVNISTIINDAVRKQGCSKAASTTRDRRSRRVCIRREPAARTHQPSAPGDILVFDRALGDGGADLVALVIARNTRGVLEFLYTGGGVIRRGFLDPARPSMRRDLDGAVVNTFLRHGKRWPPPGTRYLAGELVVHVIDVH